MVRVFAVVPVKRVAEAKSRLSRVLSPSDRMKLLFAMLEDVLHAISSSRSVERLVIVSADSAVLELAPSYGAEALKEERAGLNEAIQQATDWCASEGAQATLVLPADLPLITPMDVDNVTLPLATSNVVLVPSSDGQGTNALGRRPPRAIPPRFGANSLSKHLAEARARDLEVKLVRSERLSLDVDEPEDLVELLRRPEECGTKALVRKLLRFAAP